MDNINSLLWGRKKNKSGNTLFTDVILGKKRNRDYDKDGIPDLFDCAPRNYWRDAPIIPQALQPTAPQTLQKPQTIAQQTQQQTIVSQAPPGAVTKSDVEAKLKELNQKLQNLEQEREEARKKARSYLQPGENWPKNQRAAFNREWILKEAELRNQATAVSQLRDRIGSGYIPKSQFQDYVQSAKTEGARYVQISERSDVQRAEQRAEEKEYNKLVQATGTGTATQEQWQKFFKMQEQRGLAGTYDVKPKQPISTGMSVVTPEQRFIETYGLGGTPKDIFEAGMEQRRLKQKYFPDRGTESYISEYEPVRLGLVEAGKQTYFNILRRIQGKKETFEEGTFAPITKAGQTFEEAAPGFQRDTFGDITRKDTRTSTVFSGVPTTPSQKLGGVRKDIMLKIENLKEYEDLNQYFNVPSEVAEQQLINNIAQTTNQLLNKKYQEKINRGEIGIDQATEEFEKEFNKVTEEVYGEELKRLKKAKKLYDELQTTSGETALEIAKTGGEIGLTVGLTALGGGPALGLYGSYKLSKGYQKGTLKAEDILEGVRYPDVKVNKDIIEGTLLIGAAGLTALSKMRGLEKSIVMEELETLKKQEVKFIQLIKLGGEDSNKYKFIGEQKYGGLLNKIEVDGTIKKVGNKVFFTSGKGTAKLTGATSWNLLGSGGEATQIISQTNFVVKSGGLSFSLDTAGTRVTSLGVGTLKPTGSMGLMFTESQIKSPKPVEFFKRGIRLPSGKPKVSLTRAGKRRAAGFIERDTFEDLFFKRGITPTGKQVVKPTRLGKRVFKSLTIGGEEITEPSASFGIKISEGTYLTIGGPAESAIIETAPFSADISGRITGVGITKIIKEEAAEEAAEKGFTIFRGTGTKTPFSKTFGSIDETAGRSPTFIRFFQEGGIKVQEKAVEQNIFGGFISPELARKGLEKPVETIAKQVGTEYSPVFLGLFRGAGTSVGKEVTERVIKETPVGRFLISEGLKDEAKISPSPRSIIWSGSKSEAEEGTKGIGITGIKPIGSSVTKPSERELIMPRITQIPKQISTQIQQQQSQFTGLFSPTPIPQPTITPTTPPPGIPTIGWISFPGEKRFVQDERVGYHGYIKERGKEKKVTDKPYTREGALDRIAKYVDKNLAAQGYIRPIKQSRTIKGKKKEVNKVFNKPLPSGDGYYAQNSYKFRQYVQRGGKRISTPNKLIELQKYRLDSPQETGKIQKAKREKGVGRFFGF